MEYFFQNLLTNLSQPEYGLAVLFAASLLAATLLPLGSEPVLLALITLNPSLLWPALIVATLGNTLGGMVSWWMGWGTRHAVSRWRDSSSHTRALVWLEKLGPKACLLSWLPGVGDPLCAVAGWLKLPFWPCTLYMAIGKFFCYLVMTALLLWVFPGQL